MQSHRMEDIGKIICLGIFTGVFGNVYGTSRDDTPELLQNYLQWNYTHMNENCTDADGVNGSCQDIRICNFAAASLAMSGWPTLCGWAGKGVPKVCCGLPLVLGNRLMKQVEEEKARKRRCGTQTYEPNLSDTENKFFEIEKLLPPINIKDPNKFDPPLANATVSEVFIADPVSPRQEQFPWMASVRRRGLHWCGGTLIDRNHVLSAAQCFVIDNREPDPNDYAVYVGNIHVNEGYPFQVEKIVVHPKYDPLYYYNDLVILTLSEEILHPSFAHICLPSPEVSAMDLTGRNTTLLGWGDSSYDTEVTAVLRIVHNLPVISRRECRGIYRRRNPYFLSHLLADDFICAGEKEREKDRCQGNVGGPLMLQHNYQNLPDFHPDIPWVLVGVVSFAYKCGNEARIPGIYTRISVHMDWITKTMTE